MIRTRAVAVVLMPVALLLGSCGRGVAPGMYPVSGKVLFQGQPAEGASVLFQREDGPPPAPGGAPIVPVGQVDEKGEFTLDCGDMGYGAPPGKYRVLIQWRVRADEAGDAPAAAKKKGRQKVVADKPDGIPDRLKGRYMKAEPALLHAEVKPEKNDLPPFDLTN